jgi:hypothetical protein
MSRANKRLNVFCGLRPVPDTLKIDVEIFAKDESSWLTYFLFLDMPIINVTIKVNMNL